MNVILLNGTPADPRLPQGSEIRDRLVAGFSARGWQTAVHDLAGMVIKPCRGCFGCWLKTPGRCVIRDDADRVMADLAGAEVVALLTPITFGGYGFELKKAMDRCIPILLPFFEVRRGEIHHPHRYPVKRRFLAVGMLAASDPRAGAIFSGLAERNALNMAALATSVLVVDPETEALESRIGAALDRLEVA